MFTGAKRDVGPAHELDGGRPGQGVQVGITQPRISILGMDRLEPGYGVLKSGIAAVGELLLESDGAPTGASGVGLLVVAAAGVPGEADLRVTHWRA